MERMSPNSPRHAQIRTVGKPRRSPTGHRCQPDQQSQVTKRPRRHADGACSLETNHCPDTERLT